jgi:hypothetical protein
VCSKPRHTKPQPVSTGTTAVKKEGKGNKKGRLELVPIVGICNAHSVVAEIR